MQQALHCDLFLHNRMWRGHFTLLLLINERPTRLSYREQYKEGDCPTGNSTRRETVLQGTVQGGRLSYREQYKEGDCPTGNSARKETKRQTDKAKGRQHQVVKQELY